jgi:hypothetical protein
VCIVCKMQCLLFVPGIFMAALADPRHRAIARRNSMISRYALCLTRPNARGACCRHFACFLLHSQIRSYRYMVAM